MHESPPEELATELRLLANTMEIPPTFKVNPLDDQRAKVVITYEDGSQQLTVWIGLSDLKAFKVVKSFEVRIRHAAANIKHLPDGCTIRDVLQTLERS